MNGGSLLGRNQMFVNNQQNQQPQQQQQLQGNLNQGNQLLGQLIQLSKGSAGLNQTGGGSGGLYNFNNGTDPSFNQFLDLGDVQSTEILKGQMLGEASQLATVVLQHGIRRINGPYYNAIRQGMELFRRLDRNNPHLIDDTSELFYNQIMSNNNLYNHIVANGCLQVSALAAMRMLNGENIKGDVKIITDMIIDAIGATCGLQLLDWICRHPNGMTIFHNASHNFRNLLKRVEDAWDSIKARYDFIPGAVIPWERGQLTATLRKNDIPNNMLNGRMDVDFSGMLGGSIQAVQDLTPAHHNVTMESGISKEGRQLMMEYFNRTSQAVKSGTYPTAPSLEERNQRREDYYSVNNFDSVVKPSKYFTMENRFDYHLPDYFTQIGETGWYAAENQVMIDIMSKFTNVKTGKKFVKSEVFYLNLEWVSLCRFDISSGTGEIRFLRIPGEDALRFALTDPNRVLPFMWENDNGDVVSSFVAETAETKDLVKDNKILDLSDIQTLEKAPNILSSSNIVKVDSDAEAFAKLDASVKTFDKTKQLDAFIMATELSTPFTFENGVDSEKVYTHFRALVIGEEIPYHDTRELIRGLEQKFRYVGSPMFEQFVRGQLTNLVNRWLTECRGYPEENDGVNYFVKIDDMFEDLEAFCNELHKNDRDTFNEFVNLNKNEFLLSNLQFIKPQKETLEDRLSKIDQEDPIAMAVVNSELSQSVVLKRQVMIAQLRKEIGPVREDKVTLMESLSPAIFAIVKEARKRSELLFKCNVPILLEFETPSGGFTRSATFSDFDKSVLNCTALKGMGELILLRSAK